MTDTFTAQHPLNTPVLFLVFNRPDTTKQVFEAIRQAKPPKLYIAADGAREEKEGEDEKVESVRDYILGNMDWDCEVKTLFRKTNLGCKYAVHEAIQWFFENEEMGIILEDDVLPSASFFRFCADMLELHRDNRAVGAIVGRNDLGRFDVANCSHFLSPDFHAWGWASWRNRIEGMDIEMGMEKLEIRELSFCDCRSERLLLRRQNSLIRSGRISTWDWPYNFNLREKRLGCIYPVKNYILNIGFGPDGTHTTHSRTDDVECYDDYERVEQVAPLRLCSAYHKAFIRRVYGNWAMILMGPCLRYVFLLRSWAKKLCNRRKD